MSHTTTVKSVPIRDVSALKAAVKELQNQGVRCELRQNANPRMYYRDQLQRHLGQASETCHYMLHLQDASYDVGFIKQADNTYAPVFDDWRKSIAGVLGTPHDGPASHWSGNREDTDETLHSLGKLLMGYTKHASMNAATANGMMVESCDYDKEGNLLLVLADGM